MSPVSPIFHIVNVSLLLWRQTNNKEKDSEQDLFYAIVVLNREISSEYLLVNKERLN